MPTQTLNPSAIVSSANWASQTGGASGLDKDNTSQQWEGNIAAEARFILELDDFDNTGVASIDAIQLTTVAYLANARSGTIIGKTSLENSSGTSYYNESLSITVNGGNFATYNGTSRTTSNGSSAWTDSDIDDLRLAIIYATPPGNAVVQQAYVTVTYTQAGYGSNIVGVQSSNISKVIGVETADISKVIDV